MCGNGAGVWAVSSPAYPTGQPAHTAAAQRVAEHDYVAAAQPGQGHPGQITAQALLLAEILAQIQLDHINAQADQGGQFPLGPCPAHMGQGIVQGIGDDHRPAAILANRSRQVLGMAAHPERPQVQPHSSPPNPPPQASLCSRRLPTRPHTASRTPPYRRSQR